MMVTMDKRLSAVENHQADMGTLRVEIARLEVKVDLLLSDHRTKRGQKT